MIFEAILIGIIIGAILVHFNKKIFPTPNFKGIGVSILGAVLFLIIWRISMNSPGKLGNFLRLHFTILHCLSLLLMATGLIIGKKHLGKNILALGLLFNGVSVGIHGKMPIVQKALKEVGQDQLINILKDDKVLTHKLYHPNDIYILSDFIVYTPPWANGKVISIGDVAIAIGLCILFISVVTRDRKGN